jgi:outer membrane protein TolC
MSNEAQNALKEIRAAEADVRKAEEAVDDARATLKVAKDDYEDCVTKLRDLIRDTDQHKLNLGG